MVGDRQSIVPSPTSLPLEVERARDELVTLGKRADEAAYAAVPANTRRAYELELHCYASWCARHGVRPTPANPDVVRRYLRELADRGRDVADLPSGRPKGALGYSALRRALSAICASNVASGYSSIWKDRLIIESRRAFGAEKGEAPKKKKHAVGADGEALLLRVCDQIDDSVRGVRDRALILVGWYGARRRSEIVQARVEHFATTSKGNVLWTIPRSKTDQTGKGHVILLPLAQDERYCPVRALARWMAIVKLENGPVFRGVDMLTGAIMEAPLDPGAVARRVQHYVKLLGLDPKDFGGHSLRRGFITTARRMGRSIEDIMEVTGHRDPKTLFGYIEHIDLEEGSAARGLIDEAVARATS